jgi:hypothetical protein
MGDLGCARRNTCLQSAMRDHRCMRLAGGLQSRSIPAQFSIGLSALSDCSKFAPCSVTWGCPHFLIISCFSVAMAFLVGCSCCYVAGV